MVVSHRPTRAILGALFVFGAVIASVGSTGLVPSLSATGSTVDGGVLTVRARGALGEERMEVRVGGTVVGTFTVGTEWGDYQVGTPSAERAIDVQVAFVNDRSTPRDRNLWVDAVTFDGQIYETEDPSTFGTGVWVNGARCRPGHHRSEALACNGYFGYGDLDGSAPDDHDRSEEPLPDGRIAVVAAGNVGSELLELRLGSEVVATFELEASESLSDSPAFHVYEYFHPEPVTPAEVAVAFVNDRYQPGYDRNVRFSSLSIGSTTIEASALTLGLSARADVTRCSRRWDSERIMSCNGVATVAADASTTSAPVSAPAGAPAGLVDLPIEAGSETDVSEVATSDGAAGDDSTGDAERFHPPVLIPERPPGAVGTTAATGRFYVVGTDIVDPRGNVFYPIGANVAIEFTPYGYVFEGGNGGIGDHIEDAIAWNWNTVRATLICDNTAGVPTFDELVDGIDPTIERLTDAGIVVILECHDLTGRDPAVGSADELRIRRFWDEMTTRYRDNPYVWFNPFNEPFASENTADWAALHEFYVDRIRATGAENIIVADLPNWGQGIDLLATSSFADALSARCNTVLGWHAYGAVDQRQGTFAEHEAAIQAAQAKDMALIVGEFGVATPADWGNAGPWTWNITGFESMAELGPRYGIGLLWWHATGDTAYFSLYALKNDRSGFWTAGNSGNLTPYGQRFWDVSHQVHHRGPFAGDLADSNCGSVPS